jgi:hypothetical protein
MSTKPANAERAELERQGAKAAVRGDPAADNPLLKTTNLPTHTGEPPPLWARRRDAWREGYDHQQSQRFMQAATRHERVLFSTTRLMTFAADRPLTSATAFFFKRGDALFLVTSRHVLFDEPTGHAPDRIEIGLHADAERLAEGTTFSILLYRDGVGVWRQGMDGGGAVDVAVVELDQAAMPVPSVIEPFGLEDLPTESDIIQVGDSLAIPGFPLGFHDTVHRLPVVRHAAIASPHGIRFQGKGYFLTDGRTHRGTSGAPVLFRRRNGESGQWALLGVHSSRMDMAGRDAAQDESLGLNSAWYADILITLTDPDFAPA